MTEAGGGEGHRWSTGKAADEPPARTVEAEELTELILGGAQPAYGKPRVVNDARVTGSLDLSDATLSSPLVFEDCWFDEPLLIHRATAPYLRLTSCRVPAIAANRVRVRHDLSVRSCTVTSGAPLLPVHGPKERSAGLALEGARIGGTLDLSGTTIMAPGRAFAIYANSMDVRLRCVMMHGFTAYGSVSMINARIGEQLRLVGATIHAGRWFAINLNGSTIGGSLFFNFPNPADSINAQTTFRGAVALAGADVGGQILGNRASFSAETDALWAEALHVASDLRLAGCDVDGGMNFRAARIDGAVDLRKSTIAGKKKGGRAVDMSGARVGRDFQAGAATITSPEGDGLVLDGATVAGDVRLTDGFTSSGTLSMVGLATDGILNLTDATIEASPDWPGIVAVNARAGGGMFLRWTKVSPSAQFDGATTSVLMDDPDRWPERLSVAGFTYERFWKDNEQEPSLWDERRRIAWLARHTPLDTEPYEHLAHVYRIRGQLDRAEAVQVARLRRERASQSWGRRIRGHLWDWLTLYGFRPGRVLGLIAALVVVLTVLLSVPDVREAMRATGSSGTVYTPDGPTSGGGGQPTSPCGDGDVRCLRPPLYAIDVVVPLVDLGQRSTWRAEPHDSPGAAMEMTIAVCSLLGWILSTLLAISFTKVARSA